MDLPDSGGYNLRQLLLVAKPQDVRHIQLPRTKPVHALPLLYDTSRDYYLAHHPLPLEQVKEEKCHMSVMKGDYEPFILKSWKVG